MSSVGATLLLQTLKRPKEIGTRQESAAPAQVEGITIEATLVAGPLDAGARFPHPARDAPASLISAQA